MTLIEELQTRVLELENEKGRMLSEVQRVSAELQTLPTQVHEAYARGYAKRVDEDAVKDEDLKNKVAKGMEDIMLELRMQGCSTHIRSFGGESSEKFQSWLQDIERNLALVGHDDARARALVLQTLTGPAADFATREIKQNPDITWAELKALLDARYNDMADLAYARQKLRRMAQSKRESVQNYYERLMIHAAHAFGDEQMKESFVQLQLVEIFVDGLSDDHMVRRLIRLKPNTLADALRLATSEQQAKKAFDLRRGLRPGEEDMEVNAVTSTQDNASFQALCRLLGNCLSGTTTTGAQPLQISPVGSNEYVPQELRPNAQDAPVNALMGPQPTQVPLRHNAQPQQTPQRQNYANGPQRPARTITCYECGGPNHYAKDCVLRAQPGRQRGPRPQQNNPTVQFAKNA